MEGIIKSVSIDPIKLESADTSAYGLIRVHLDAKAFAKLYEAHGVDPSTVTTNYITFDENNDITSEPINLKEAADTNHDISNYFFVNFATTNH